MRKIAPTLVLSLVRSFCSSSSSSQAGAIGCFQPAATSFSRRHQRVFVRLWSTSTSSSSSSSSSDPGSPLGRAEQAFSFLAKRGKSWKRLRHLVDLASSDTTTASIRGVADIGTDHGLLALGLVVTGRFDRVLGIDISQHALDDGALRLKKEVDAYRKDHNVTSAELNVEFRLGNGLRAVHPGEADAVCIAGMGVNSIIDILSSSASDGELLLDHLNSQHLILQPTNSRPRHLMLLYDHLHELGWCVQEERIECMSSRWYISTLFAHADSMSTRMSTLPGEQLAALKENDPTSFGIFRDYVRHHCVWIRQNMEKAGGAPVADSLWLQTFEDILN